VEDGDVESSAAVVDWLSILQQNLLQQSTELFP